MNFSPTGTDTIIALSTPAGVGAIGVVRLSGPQAIAMTDEVFFGKKLEKQASHTLHFGTIKDGDTIVDEVVVSLFKGPHSFTKENVVEVSCHGSPYIIQQIIELFIRKGARTAKPGEFTLRAFLNGRFDLSQAEAVGDLIASDSKASHQLAMQQMRGGFSDQIKELRDKLIHFASMIELELDFAEEDVEFADRDDLKTLIYDIQKLIKKLVASFQLGNVLKNGVATVIAGRPNAGKSTLLNALLQEERAIVSDIAGTTRDTIEEVLNINGILFRLIDTAGIREAKDSIERIGVEKTMQKIDLSAVVLYMFDVNELTAQELEADLQKIRKEGTPLLVVANKTDLAPADWQSNYPNINLVGISAKAETDLDDLRAQLVSNVMDTQLEMDGGLVTNIRHYDVLLRADQALNDVLTGLDKNMSGELLALDIRQALHALGEITGEVTNDDLLGNIFSKFCIGK